MSDENIAKVMKGADDEGFAKVEQVTAITNEQNAVRSNMT